MRKAASSSSSESPHARADLLPLCLVEAQGRHERRLLAVVHAGDGKRNAQLLRGEGAMAERIVTVECPSCAYRFVAGHIVDGAWWAEGLTPEKVARHPYCERCGHKPPMRVVREELPLFQVPA